MERFDWRVNDSCLFQSLSSYIPYLHAAVISASCQTRPAGTKTHSMNHAHVGAWASLLAALVSKLCHFLSRSQIPKMHCSRAICSCRILSARRNSYRINTRRTAIQEAHSAARVDVPKPSGFVFGACGSTAARKSVSKAMQCSEQVQADFCTSPLVSESFAFLPEII